MNHKYKAGAYVVLQYSDKVGLGYIHKFSHFVYNGPTSTSKLSPIVYVMTYKYIGDKLHTEENLNYMYIKGLCYTCK